MSKELMIGFLTKAYNKSEDEIAALIYNGDDEKDTALQTLIDLDALKVKKLKDEQTKAFDNGAKKREKEIRTANEQWLKDTFEIDSDLVGDDLFSEVKTKFETIKTSKPSKLPEDEVKKHPVFIEHEKKLKKSMEEAIAAKDAEFATFKIGIERNNKISVVKTKASNLLDSFKPILPKDAVKATNQRNLFLQQLEGYDYEIPEDGTPVILKEGKRLETENGYPVAFDKFVKEKAEAIFEFAAQDAKGSTGNGQQEEKKKINGAINMFPKSQSEFGEALMSLGNDNAKIVELNNNWQDFQSK